MNYKTTNKYFTQKNTLMYIGIGIAAIGLFFTIFWWWGFGAGIIAAGVACIVINREGLVKGEEVDAEVRKKEAEFEEKTAAAYNITRAGDVIVTFTDYIFDGENIMSMRKGTDGKFRPKKAMTTCMFMTGSKLIIEKKAFSIVDENENESTSVLDLSDISQLAIKEKLLEGNGGVLLKYRMLEIKDKAGVIASEMPIPQSSVLYDRISDINREIKAAHKAEK